MIQIRIGGWAGQGVVLAGTILANAFSAMGKNVVMTRSYTAAVRSGITTSDIIVDDSEIYDLVITKPDVMIFMYDKTFQKYMDLARKAKYVILDSSLIKNYPDNPNIYPVDASEIAEKISSPKLANIVLIGAYAKITSHLDLETIEKAVRENVSRKFIDDDISALHAGFSL